MQRLYVDRFVLAGDGSNAGASRRDDECINLTLRQLWQPKGEGEEWREADGHGNCVWERCRSGAARFLTAGIRLENRILVDLGLIKRFQLGKLLRRFCCAQRYHRQEAHEQPDQAGHKD